MQKASASRSNIVYSWLGNLAVSCVSFFTGDVFAIDNMIQYSAEAYDDYRVQQAKHDRAEQQYISASKELEHERENLSRLKEEMRQDEAMLKEELKASLWQLERQDIVDCNALQERLLQSSWNLLRKYHLPDEYRLTQGSLNNFYRAVQEQNITRRARPVRGLLHAPQP